MATKNQPAFPTDDGMTGGLTLREYFAAAALQGLLARYDAMPDMAARLAFKYADAMLEESDDD